MTANLLSVLFAANIAGGLAALAVLTLRRPARTLIGARAAYALWLAIPAAMAATLLPARTVVLPAPPPLPFVAPVAAAPVLEPTPATPAIQEPASVQPAPSKPPFHIEDVLLGLWLSGAGVSLGFLAIGQRRAIARFGRLTRDRSDPHVSRASKSAVGPALLGVVKPRIVLPADFESQFEAEERDLILAHEQAHLAAGDAVTNGLAALLVAVNWFNPLLHIAARAARIDQELACDAVVIARHPDQRQAYARALVKTQVTSTPLPLGCYWPGRNAGLLMERVEMLDRRSPGRIRLLAGAAAVAVLTAGAGLAAWAAQPPSVTVAPPPADSLASLATDVSAVLDGNRLLVTETDHDVAATRTLSVGDEYRDGWTIASISNAYAVLTKGGASRVITFKGHEAAPQPEVAAPAPTQLATANSAAGGDRMAIEAAVAAGDLRRVVELGGTAMDAARAFATHSPIASAELAEGAEPRFEKVGLLGAGDGQLSVVLVSTLYPPRRINIVVPELSDLPVPANAPADHTIVPDGYHGRPSWEEPGLKVTGLKTPAELRLDLSRAADYLIDYGSASDRSIGLQMRDRAVNNTDGQICALAIMLCRNAERPVPTPVDPAVDPIRDNMVRLAQSANPELSAQYQQQLVDYDAWRQSRAPVEAQ